MLPEAPDVPVHAPAVSGAARPEANLSENPVVSLRWLFQVPVNPELNSRIDELGEYRRGHEKLTPLGVVSGCRIRRDRFCERLALLLEF